MSEAAKLVDVSRSTIRRYREAGYFPNAYQDSDRQWMIPIEDLLAKGLKPVGELRKVIPLMAPAQPVDEPSSPDAPTLLKLLSDAEHALELERANHKGTERLLHEVERRAELAERALLMIESPKPEPHSPIAMPSKVGEPTPAHVDAPKKPWWKRG
jgi:DNA-binding transcriptional MerR regulator